MKIDMGQKISCKGYIFNIICWFIIITIIVIIIFAAVAFMTITFVFEKQYRISVEFLDSEAESPNLSLINCLWVLGFLIYHMEVIVITS